MDRISIADLEGATEIDTIWPPISTPLPQRPENAFGASRLSTDATTFIAGAMHELSDYESKLPPNGRGLVEYLVNAHRYAVYAAQLAQKPSHRLSVRQTGLARTGFTDFLTKELNIPTASMERALGEKSLQLSVNLSTAPSFETPTLSYDIANVDPDFCRMIARISLNRRRNSINVFTTEPFSGKANLVGVRGAHGAILGDLRNIARCMIETAATPSASLQK